MEKPNPSAPDLRHLVSVTTNAVESFLAADFAKVDQKEGKKKKEIPKQAKDSSSDSKKEKKKKKPKPSRSQGRNPLYEEIIL